MATRNRLHPSCPGITRRAFLADVGMGFTGLALGSLLFQDGVRAESPKSKVPSPGSGANAPHFAGKAKRVICLFMVGGASHMEGFDPKPELNVHAGKTLAETPYKAILDSPLLKENLREFVAGRKILPKIYPLQVGYRKWGQSGLEISDWWPNVASMADDLAVVRSMWTTDNDHGAQLQFLTGKHVFEGSHPTVGAWVHYGLGSLNENLPEFVVLGSPLSDCCGGRGGHGASYLGPEHGGVLLNVDPKNPLPFASPGPDRFREEQEAEFDLLGRLNRLAGIQYPEDPALRARINNLPIDWSGQREMLGFARA